MNAQLVSGNPLDRVWYPGVQRTFVTERAYASHFRLLFTGADIGSAAGTYPRCYVQLAEVGFYTLVSPSPPPPPALPPPPPLAPIDLSGTVPVTLVELFQAGAVTPTSGGFMQGDGETTTLQVITSYDPDAMNIHPSYPAARPADGINKATIDFVAAGYQHCVRVSGQIWMHSTVDPTTTNGVLVEFSGVGEAPFALYQLCEVSPSCLPDDLGEAGGVSFVNPFNGAGYDVEGRAVLTVYDKGDANYDSARARVTFDCKPLPACDSSFTYYESYESWVDGSPPRCQGETCYTPQPGERYCQYIVPGDGNSALRFVDGSVYTESYDPWNCAAGVGEDGAPDSNVWASASTCRRRRRPCRPRPSRPGSGFSRSKWTIRTTTRASPRRRSTTQTGCGAVPVRRTQLRGRWVRQPALAPRSVLRQRPRSQAPASGSLFPPPTRTRGSRVVT